MNSNSDSVEINRDHASDLANNSAHYVDSAIDRSLEITVDDRAKIQADVLVFPLRAFRDEFDEERVNEIAQETLTPMGIVIEDLEKDAAGETMMERSPKYSLHEQVKIQAETMVPLIKALQQEFGAARTNEVARRGLQKWQAQFGADIGKLFQGTDVDKMADSFPTFTEEACDYTVLKRTPQAFDLNVTRCKYAELFKELGAPEIGAMIYCDADFVMTDACGPDVELLRDKTIMKGYSHCNFRWRAKTDGSE